MFPAVITALAFIITFIVVGLVVVAAAFSGGRRHTERPAGPSRTNRRAVAVGVGVLVVLLGVLVPALVIAAAKDSDKAPGGVELTAADEHGRQVFAERCATCHTLRAANAVGKVGPNLDQLVGGLDPKGQKAFILDAIKEGRARGQGQMPKGLVDGQDAQDVAAFVSAVAGH
jgi:mono/diheme cytochrome c family protein